MALPPAETTSTSPAHSKDEEEADTTSNRQAVSSAGSVQTPTQQTNMPKIITNHFHAHTYIAGNIRNCLVQWKALTHEQWIHQVVEGYQIGFSSPPRVGIWC